MTVIQKLIQTLFNVFARGSRIKIPWARKREVCERGKLRGRESKRKKREKKGGQRRDMNNFLEFVS